MARENAGVALSAGDDITGEPTGVVRVFIDHNGWPCGRKVLGRREGASISPKKGSCSMNDESYGGYLSPHLDLIRAMHEAGHGTRAIAEQLFADGARASTSDPNVRPSKLSREHHIKNLRADDAARAPAAWPAHAPDAPATGGRPHRLRSAGTVAAT